MPKMKSVGQGVRKLEPEQPDTHTHTHTDRQTDTHTHIHTHCTWVSQPLWYVTYDLRISHGSQFEHFYLVRQYLLEDYHAWSES